MTTVSNEIIFVHPSVSRDDQELLLNGFPPGHPFHTTEQGHQNAWVESIPTQPIQDHEILAHIMARTGLFPSAGQARKNGWDKPIPRGFSQFTVGKKKLLVTILTPWE